MENKTARNTLVVLLLFLGLGAIFGGAILIIYPLGTYFNMPLSLLKNSPFSDFLIPGIILLSVLGVAPIYIAYALIKKPINKLAERLNFYQDMNWPWTFSIYIGFALIIWIQTEMTILQTVHWLHSLYMFIAIAIIFTALLSPVRNNYKK